MRKKKSTFKRCMSKKLKGKKFMTKKEAKDAFKKAMKACKKK